jgi:hypothetical protein
MQRRLSDSPEFVNDVAGVKASTITVIFQGEMLRRSHFKLDNVPLSDRIFDIREKFSNEHAVNPYQLVFSHAGRSLDNDRHFLLQDHFCDRIVVTVRCLGVGSYRFFFSDLEQKSVYSEFPVCRGQTLLAAARAFKDP